PPDWNDFSSVAPVRKLRARTRMVAFPRPCLLCEYSSTFHNWPSCVNVTPFLKSSTPIIEPNLLQCVSLARLYHDYIVQGRGMPRPCTYRSNHCAAAPGKSFARPRRSVHFGSA